MDELEAWPSLHLLVQSQQQKHEKKIWNMVKVNKKHWNEKKKPKRKKWQNQKGNLKGKVTDSKRKKCF